MRWVLVASQAIGQEKIASSCTKGGLGWILGKISSPEGLSSFGTGCSGKRLVTIPGNLLMWHLGIWFRGGHGRVRFAIGLDDLLKS